MGKIFRSVFTRMAAVVACLLVLEVVLRVFHLSPINDYRKILDSSHPYALRPNATMVEVQPDFQNRISINATGFRDAPFQLEKKPESTRIAVLGDSFTFGTGVGQEERASDRLQFLLRGQGIPCEVYNFALPNAETVHETEVLMNSVLRYHPDYVLLMFYIGNDIVNNYKLSISQPKRYTRRNPLYWIVDEIRLHSHIFQLVMMRIASVPVARKWYNRVKTKNLWGEVGEQMIIFNSTGENESGLWDPTFQALKHLVHLSQANGVAPIIVLVPTKLQFDQRLWGELLHAQKLNPGDFELTRPNAMISSFVKDTLEVDVLDPLSKFQEAYRNGEDIYYPTNGHWRAVGHEILAQHLVEYFKTKLPQGQL